MTEIKGSPIVPTTKQQANSIATMEELEILTAPLIDWLRKHHNPHTAIYISWDYVSVKHDGMGIPFPYSGE
jgi:hypothetical protein